MASLELRNGKYRAVFRYGGQKFSRSLRTENEQKAQLSLARLEDNLQRLELGTLDLPPNVDVSAFLLSDCRMTQRRSASPIRTLAKLTTSFIDAIPEGTLENSTVSGMEIHIRHLTRILGPSFHLCDMSLEVLQGYVQTRRNDKGVRGKRVSPATIKKEIVTLTSIWRWAKHMGHVDGPLNKRGLRYPKTIEKPPFQTWHEIEHHIEVGGLSESEAADLWDCLFLTLSEIKELLEDVKRMARFEFIYSMVAFAAHTGARRSEIMRSRITDIDLKRNLALIREKKRVRGRLSTRRVPISPFLSDVLRNWINSVASGPYLFSFRPHLETNTEPLTPDQAHHHLQITLQDSKWNTIRGWHVFRHSFCSNCAAKGVDQRIINAWVGHQTEEMVRRYRHLIPNQQQEAIEQVFA